MANLTVVLAGEDTAELERIKLLLEFAGAQGVTAARPHEVAKKLTGHSALFIAPGNDVGEIAAAVDEGVPLFGIGEEARHERLLTTLRYPLEYGQIVTALHRIQLFHEARHHAGSEGERFTQVIVGESPVMRSVRHLVSQVADSEANVLILGESGTGKEVVARSLHHLSSRRDKPFVPVNCGAIPADLLESELFGHEKGAFTGALTARQGRFEIAEGGTLFLDEIGDMPMPMQVKLLRVLQERSFERVGSNRAIAADVRIIAATHHNLEDCIRAGTFREDLYYRLNVFPIEMPALRERNGDVPLLVTELINRLERAGRGTVRLTPAALSSLVRYPWPGNVRELANLMERLVIMYPRGIVDFGDLPLKFQVKGSEDEPAMAMPSIPPASERLSLPPPESVPHSIAANGLDLKEYLAQLELSYIQKALDESGGVVAHAAELLKMRRTTLVEKIRKYGVQRDDVTEA